MANKYSPWSEVRRRKRQELKRDPMFASLCLMCAEILSPMTYQYLTVFKHEPFRGRNNVVIRFCQMVYDP